MSYQQWLKDNFEDVAKELQAKENLEIMKSLAFMADIFDENTNKND